VRANVKSVMVKENKEISFLVLFDIFLYVISVHAGVMLPVCMVLDLVDQFAPAVVLEFPVTDAARVAVSHFSPLHTEI
jgi:hypothetical protein